MGATPEQLAEAVAKGISDCMEGRPCNPPGKFGKWMLKLLTPEDAREIDQCYIEEYRNAEREGKFGSSKRLRDELARDL
jgi:hypothetical protein